ncbi:unnamed protein product [Medioppia subpectinata]|uniref:Exportin-5 C-terminal domain-containing protein n=1 Tax=Medioppia subpectinata TaxID=1979941 RepID=A0A7R9KS30_9ACAR|nr:unnamed protein product [Medioppia subpectinata]CAG2108737.1 unnamed protein product [Medioppia subpectinata]
MVYNRNYFIHLCHSIDVIMDEKSGLQERNTANQYMDSFKSNQNVFILFDVSLRLLNQTTDELNTKSVVYKVFGLQTLEVVIKFHWNSIDDSLKQQIKQLIQNWFLVDLSSDEVVVKEWRHMMNGLSRCVVEVETKSKDVKNLRRHACSLFIKICQTYPTLLVPLFPTIKSYIQSEASDLQKLSQMERCALYEGLVLISNEFEDIKHQEEFIRELIASINWIKDYKINALEFICDIGLHVESIDDNTYGQKRANILYVVNLMLEYQHKCYENYKSLVYAVITETDKQHVLDIISNSEHITTKSDAYRMQWNEIKTKNSSIEEGMKDESEPIEAEVISDQINRFLGKEFIELLAVILSPTKGNSSDISSDVFDTNISELGNYLLNTIPNVIIYPTAKALSWLDSNTALKTSHLNAVLIRKIIKDQMIRTEDAIFFLLEQLINGLSYFGEHEQIQSILLDLILILYEGIAIKLGFSAIKVSLSEMSGSDINEWNHFEDKLINCQKIKFTDKKKKELLRKLVSPLIGKNIGQLYKHKNIEIKNLKPIFYTKSSRINNSVEDDVSLCLLFNDN